jgi:hypothetical protein
MKAQNKKKQSSRDFQAHEVALKPLKRATKMGQRTAELKWIFLLTPPATETRFELFFVIIINFIDNR